MPVPKYFYDFEFIEGIAKRSYGKNRHFIDMISIGIVCSDGRRYSAISADYDYEDANDWVKENIIKPLYLATVPEDKRTYYSVNDFHKIYGKTEELIALEIKSFIQEGLEDDDQIAELYGYYSGYDHVLFASLHGTMMDLPKGFPMLTYDIKQMLDEKVKEYMKFSSDNLSFEEALARVIAMPDYPANDNEHDAEADAVWNQKLYHFVKNL